MGNYLKLADFMLEENELRLDELIDQEHRKMWEQIDKSRLDDDFVRRFTALIECAHKHANDYSPFLMRKRAIARDNAELIFEIEQMIEWAFKCQNWD